MRELKFRVWDKDAAKYVDGVGELYVDILEVGTRVFRIEQMCPGRYAIEQYTGLKDKNGKEICEGDIMRYDAIDYQVLWAGYYAGFETKRLNSPWNNAGLTLHFLASVGRVIGNIHENPELLEEEE